MILLKIIVLVIDAIDILLDTLTLRWSSDQHFLGTNIAMNHGILITTENSRSFHHNIDIQFFPRALGGVTMTNHQYALVQHTQPGVTSIFLFICHIMGVSTVVAIVLEEIRANFCRSSISTAHVTFQGVSYQFCEDR